ncbi:hypothetical protein ES703_52971 [subsurface metagenome]
MKKIITIIGFMLYGVVAGFISIWFRQHTDMVFLLNIPGTLCGDAVYGLSIRFFGDLHSSQAHYTIPWLLRIPQVYLPASAFFWGVLGTLFAMIFRPKVVTWIMGIYILMFGIITVLVTLGLI